MTWYVAQFPSREDVLITTVVSGSGQPEMGDIKPENLSISFIRPVFTGC